jgi:hypothetical protein
MVTAEFAVALPAFVLVVLAAVFAVAAVMAQLRCVDAAAIAARMAARGDAASAVRSASLASAPSRAQLEITGASDLVTATVRASVSPFAALRFLPAVTVQAHVVQAREPADPSGATLP